MVQRNCHSRWFGLRDDNSLKISIEKIAPTPLLFQIKTETESTTTIQRIQRFLITSVRHRRICA